MRAQNSGECALLSIQIQFDHNLTSSEELKKDIERRIRVIEYERIALQDMLEKWPKVP